jgi:hypothetical protein
MPITKRRRTFLHFRITFISLIEPHLISLIIVLTWGGIEDLEACDRHDELVAPDIIGQILEDREDLDSACCHPGKSYAAQYILYKLWNTLGFLNQTPLRHAYNA